MALLTGADERTCELCFQYGRNLGLAFQLVDDLLDFVSSAQAMGKPTAADLKLGLATAPVLFACEKVNISIKAHPGQSSSQIIYVPSKGKRPLLSGKTAQCTFALINSY